MVAVPNDNHKMTTSTNTKRTEDVMTLATWQLQEDRRQKQKKIANLMFNTWSIWSGVASPNHFQLICPGPGLSDSLTRVHNAHIRKAVSRKQVYGVNLKFVACHRSVLQLLWGLIFARETKSTREKKRYNRRALCVISIRRTVVSTTRARVCVWTTCG